MLPSRTGFDSRPVQSEPKDNTLPLREDGKAENGRVAPAIRGTWERRQVGLGQPGKSSRLYGGFPDSRSTEGSTPSAPIPAPETARLETCRVVPAIRGGFDKCPQTREHGAGKAGVVASALRWIPSGFDSRRLPIAITRRTE